MKANCCKIKAYIGFAKKSRSIIFGVDDIEKLSKKCHIAIASRELSESSLKKLESVSQKSNFKLVLLGSETCKELFDSEVIKAVAITDKNLSDAIKKHID